MPRPLPSLAPVISANTLNFHYGKHHKTYVETLNKLIVGTEFADMPLEKIVRATSGQAAQTAIFNNAAQAWNHTFYWNCLKANGGGTPEGALLEAINTSFGSFEEFKTLFTNMAIGLFGSGWVWLVKDEDGTLGVEAMSNAGNPLVNGQTPLLTCDVWEHAYYIDYRNARAKYVETFWNLVNWEFVEKNLKI